jgi:two-component system chemotaxis response regulator CheB
MNSKVRVLIVDDSSFFRRRISDILSREPGIEVAGVAADGLQAVKQTHLLKPDVITMDVEMPVMDGISAVRKIMAEIPTPILMFSSLTHDGARATLDALDAGAVDFLPKQMNDMKAGAGGVGSNALVQRVLTLGRRRTLSSLRSPKPAATTAPKTAAIQPALESVPRRASGYRLVAIGASTGGPVAIQNLLTALPKNFPIPLVLIIHMPESFTPAYAERLNAMSRIDVKEAQSGDQLLAGKAYLAPGGKQMLLERQGNRTCIRIEESASGQTYRPSVDITFGSAARVMGKDVLAIVLTGMGSDGKQGAKLLKEGGANVWSQDEQSCVVYGMPQAVEKAGLSDRVLPLSDIGPTLAKVN